MQIYCGGPGPLALKTCPDMSGYEKANNTDSNCKHRIMLCCWEFSNDSCLPLTWPYKAPLYPALVNLSRLSQRQILLSPSSLATSNYFKYLHFLNLPGFSCLHALPIMPRLGSYSSLTTTPKYHAIFLCVFTTAMLHLWMFNKLSPNLVA